MRQTFCRIFLSGAVFAAVFMTSCGNQEKSETAPDSGADSAVVGTSSAYLTRPWEDPKFAGWQRTEFENVVVYFPPGHLHQADMSQTAKNYRNAITKISGTAQLPVPTDTIRVFYFTGPGQGFELTQRPFPYGDSIAVYYWPNYSHGVSLMQRLFYSYFGGWSTQQIMHHGLIALFDFSGENHHETTLEFMRDTFFIPLSRLASDTAMNSDYERYQSGEAGSLVAYILASRGSTGIEAMYRSTLPFDQAVQQVMGITLDSLQKEWIGFIEANVGPIDTTKARSGS